MNRKAHWEHVFQTKPATAVSWYEAAPARSLRFLEAVGFTPSR
ncbi:MAG: hypothetical protein ACRD2X_03860 [Vicinamibacteraceae bacterium]